MDFLWTKRGEMAGKDGFWIAVFRPAEILQISQLYFRAEEFTRLLQDSVTPEL
jgi:hypothetical protein